MMSIDRFMHGGSQSMPLPMKMGDGFSFPVEAKKCPKKRKGERPAKSKALHREKGVATEAVDHTGGGERLICSTCSFPITGEKLRMEVSGAHTHGFANPHGLYYDIGCFAFAPGCAFSSEGSAEFTWFVGYRWRLAVCRGCGSHMGWLFESETSSFVALILTALTLEEEGERG